MRGCSGQEGQHLLLPRHFIEVTDAKLERVLAHFETSATYIATSLRYIRGRIYGLRGVKTQENVIGKEKCIYYHVELILDKLLLACLKLIEKVLRPVLDALHVFVNNYSASLIYS